MSELAQPRQRTRARTAVQPLDRGTVGRWKQEFPIPAGDDRSMGNATRLSELSELLCRRPELREVSIADYLDRAIRWNA
jgi:hypothetical protein